MRSNPPPPFSLCPRPPADNIPKGSNSCNLQWVTKWVDYSNKYGFGYQLSDHTVGVLFNNGTHMSLLPDRKYAIFSLLRCSNPHVCFMFGVLSLSLSPPPQDHPLLCRVGSALRLSNVRGSRALCGPGDRAQVLFPLHGGEPDGRKLRFASVVRAARHRGLRLRVVACVIPTRSSLLCFLRAETSGV